MGRTASINFNNKLLSGIVFVGLLVREDIKQEENCFTGVPVRGDMNRGKDINQGEKGEA
jgi:hypothetical protein